MITPRPRCRIASAGLLVLVLAAGALTGCGSSEGGADAASTTVTDVSQPDTTLSTVPALDAAPIWEPEVDGRRRLAGFGDTLATVTGAGGQTCQVCLMMATSTAQQQRGLMEVTDSELGGYDGMVFVDESPHAGAFWMRNTRIPLTAVFFDGDGGFVSRTAMEPCPDSTSDAACPRYPADGPYQYAVELAARTPEELLMTDGSTLHLDHQPCPIELEGR